MNADQPYRIIQFISNKFENGYISPDQYNDIINQAQTSFLDYLLGQFQSYQSGRPLSRVQWGMNEIVRQRVTPLISAPSTFTPDVTGRVPYPTDFQQMDAIWTSTMQRVRYVPQHKLFSYLNSQIDPVSSNPIFLIEDQGFLFYPNTTYNNTTFGNILLSYVKTPPAIVWGFILDPNGIPTYNPGSSTSPVWYDVDMLEITARALKMVGINLEAPQIEAYANQVIDKGQ